MKLFSNLVRGIQYQFARKTIISLNKMIKTNPQDLENSSQKTQNNGIKSSIEQSKQLNDQFEFVSQEMLQLYKQKAKNEVSKSLSYRGEDPSPNKLVNRPAKGAVWGLGGQLIIANRKIELEGIRDQIEEVVKFLSLQQVKNIYVHDWTNTQQKDINKKRYSIVCSCFSARHCWKVGIQLKNAFNKHMLQKKRNQANKKLDLVTALMVGRKDEEWILVDLMTEEQRQETDLEYKWNHQVPEEVIERHVKMNQNRKSRKKLFEDFD